MTKSNCPTETLIESNPKLSIATDASPFPKATTPACPSGK